jgi:glycosyltransferase involved in cell wall biosynthesis/2-polyprenyl-3-methyl-5-hydroxy-6-metoxy-1,4-benzoquinol methylase
MNFVIVSPGMQHDGNTLKERSLGGSETAAIQLAEAIAARKDPFGGKCRVTVFSPCEKPVLVNGVHYVPIQAAKELIAGADVDVLITSRALEVLMDPNVAKVNYLWCHDLALGRQADAFRGVLYQTDRVLLMSKFQAAQYREVTGIGEESIEVIRNGIDLALFSAPRSVPREEGLMVYSARPERGLENLVGHGGIMEKLAQAGAPIRLAVAYYDNTVSEMRAFYEMLWARCRALPNVEIVGSLTKKQLYDLYSRAWLYVYPTPGSASPNFSEISCITAMEIAACGLPILTNPVGALPETVKKGCGVIVQGTGTDPGNVDVFVREIYRIAKDPLAWKRMSDACYKQGFDFSWDPVAARLIDLSDELMREKSADRTALYKHFYKLSEIDGCRRIEAEGPLEMCEKEQSRIAEGWKFTESPEAYREQYKKVDAGASVAHYEQSENEPRLQVLLNFLRQNPGKYKRILDYGCWIGHQAIRIANEYPDAEVVGLDITPRNIELAEECKAKYSKHGNVSFLIHDEMDGAPRMTIAVPKEDPYKDFDLVLCNEVLEHVLDPEHLIGKLESFAADGGTIFLTTPSGPWEAMSYDTFPHRCHLRHYEQADLDDIFGEKESPQIFWKSVTQDNTGRALGHHYVTYVNRAGKSTGSINWERKMAYQAPRQTLSVCMIAYNAEDMLHRCLKSVRGVADEIIIAVDPKTTDSTREIALQHGARVIDGVNPLDPAVDGFEEARNFSIAGARGSWILWIDDDEELLQPEKLNKYLRKNPMNGYAVQQHHLSVDPPMALKPDMPIRLFRNGMGIRFYGIVHEHPERELNKGVGNGITLSDTWIAHDGYLTEAIRKSRFLRNIDLVFRDRKKYPERILGFFLLLRDLVHLTRYHLQMSNGAPPSPQVMAWAKEAQELFESRYLNNPGDPMVPDALTYYSEANRILGKGLPMRFKFQVANTPEKEIVGQFSNSEKMAGFVSGVLKSVGGHFEGRYF